MLSERFNASKTARDAAHSDLIFALVCGSDIVTVRQQIANHMQMCNAKRPTMRGVVQGAALDDRPV